MEFFSNKKQMVWAIFGGIYAFGILLCILVVVYVYRTQIQNFYLRADSSSISEIQLHEQMLHSELSDVASDLRFLSRNQVMQRYADQPDAQSRLDLMAFWKRLMVEREIYDQIRLLDNDGMELMRINYNDKAPLVVPDIELADKSDRYYFKGTAALGMGRIYVSSLDVNFENGKPEYPFKPTIRFGMGVYNSSLERIGYLILNYNASLYLDMLRQSSQFEDAEFMLVDQDGYWIMHPDKRKEWGKFTSDGKTNNFALQYPEVWQRINEQRKGKFIFKDEVFDFDTLDLQEHEAFVSTQYFHETEEGQPADQGRQIKYIAMLPGHVIGAYRNKIRTQCIVLVLIWLVLAMLPSWGLATIVSGYFCEHSELAHKAHHDTVTGLANRVLFNERLEHAVGMSERYSRQCAVLYIDLDGFKPINDTHGHHIGDELLVSVASRMVCCVRKTDIVARVGGDEFAILLSEIKNRNDAMCIGEKVVTRLLDPIPTSKEPVNVGASLGVAVYPQDGQGPDALMEFADKQMYRNKRSHKKNHNLSLDAS